MRGDLEDQRLERLSKMHDTIRALKGLSDEEKKRVTRKLKSIMDPSLPKPIESAEPQIELEVQADPADIIGLLLSSEEREPVDRPSEQAVRRTEQLQTQTLPLPPALGDPDCLFVSPFTHLVQADATLPPSGSVQEPTSHPKAEKGEESLEAIADTLANLYKEYQDSVFTFNNVLTSSEYSSAAAGEVPIFLSASLGPSVDSLNDKRRAGESCESISEESYSEEEPSPILRASRHQVELMDMESEAWSLLSSAAGSSSQALQKDDTAPAKMLSHLSQQSMIGIPADQLTTTVGVVGTTPDPAFQIDSSNDDRYGSQRPTPSTPAQFVEQAEETFHHVEQRSEAIAASYKRRMDAPTARTYREAQGLLQAMGVPVVVTEGGEEAEAVASALVLEGIGDYVATEDTVSDLFLREASLMGWLGCPHSRCNNAP